MAAHIAACRRDGKTLLLGGCQCPFASGRPAAKRQVCNSDQRGHDEVARTASETLITVIGGSGFIGRHIVQALAKRGYRIRVAVRRPDLAGYVQPLGTPGQIMPVQANVRYPGFACRVMRRCGGGHQSHRRTLFGGRAKLRCDPCLRRRSLRQGGAQRGAKQFFQMSAIGADPDSASEYAKSKAEGEARARANFPGAIVIRPSIIFGPEDDFFNRFAAMARFSPALPLIGGGTTKFQPVYCGDVAEAFARLIDAGDRLGHDL